MKAIIINPTYNEKENIGRLINILEEEVFPNIKNWEMGILVADDNSPDGTADVVRELMKKHKNLHLLEGAKKGLGAAYVRAMDYAIKELGADVVFEMDSDLQHDPKKVAQFLKKIEEGYDFVIGTRYSDGGSIPATWGLHRKFLSVFGNLFIRLILMRFSIHDWTGGYRAMKKEVFLKEKEKIKKYTGYHFQVGTLLNVIQDGYKVAEVPFHFKDRTAGRSKIPGMQTIVNTFSFVIIERIKELKRFIKFLFVGGTGFIVQYLTAYLFIMLNFEQFIAAMIAGEAAIISNFILNNIWTFKDTKAIKQHGNFFLRLLKFNIASLASIGIQGLAVYLAVLFWGETLTILGHEIHTSLVILFPTIIFLVLPLNYLIYNKIIWKTQYLKNKTKI
ncbi:glycosyltransferase [Candidatus Roizmanbacteria bacterium]|nr:glycosyltransferase [Candidatus Roizmanbacteria bacterium]